MAMVHWRYLLTVPQYSTYKTVLANEAMKKKAWKIIQYNILYLLRRGSYKLRKASIPMARAGGLKMPSHSNSTYIPYRTLTTYGTYCR